MGEDKKYFVQIARLLLVPEDTVCKLGRHTGKKLVGCDVILDLQPYEDHWASGTIINPKTGGEYKCSCWFEGDNLNELLVRGTHWTGIYRTQTWTRM